MSNADIVLDTQREFGLFGFVQTGNSDLIDEVALHFSEAIVVEETVGEALDSIYRPCLIWLDASTNGARIRFDLREAMQRTWGNVILISNASLFDLKVEYPSLAEVEYTASGGGYLMSVKNDVIRLVKDPRFS